MQSAFETFLLSIEQIGKNLRKYKDGQAAELGLRGIHVMVLHQLSKSEEGMTAAGLSRACGVNRAFVSRVVSELLSLSLIAYDAPQTERLYRARLRLTENGRGTVEQMNRRIEEAVAALGADIRPRDMAVFYSVLHRIDARIQTLVDASESCNADMKEDF